jgi:hypothetical protein
LLSPEHASIIERYGWSKDSVKKYIWQRAKIPANRHSNQNQIRHEGVQADHWKWLLNRPPADFDDLLLPVVETPDRYQVVVVGGPVGKTMTFSCSSNFLPVEIKNRTAS